MHQQMGVDAQERARSAEEALRNTWLLLLLVGALTGLLVVVGSAATLLPLRRLTRRAEAISAGNIVVEPLPVRGSNDIRSLTRTTNEMTALLGEVEHEIHRLADGDFDEGHSVDLPGTIGESIQGSMNRLHDITRQLQRSEQLASAIVAGAGDAIWTIDGNGVVLTANDASARLTGVGADVQPGQPIDRFLSATSGSAVMRSASGEEWSVLVSASTIDTDSAPIRVVIAHDISERLDFEQQLALQARRDPLTGLPNRLAVIERIGELTLSQARAAVLYLDLDGFKSVNDLRGHSMGDEVLAEVARRLKANVSHDDLVGRLGGDEFIVVSTTLLDQHDIADLGSRLIGTIEQPFTSEDLINLSASIGVVMLDGHVDAETVLSEADSALYQAKHRGKGRLEVFDRDLQAAVAHQTELELALRRAIPNGELVLHLQPIVDLRTNRIDGAEALVRWERHGHGLVPPNDFIPIAERSSLIIDLDRWVIEQCCERIAKWRRVSPGTELRLAVNISGRHLMEGNLVADVAAALSRTGADPSMLEIELTETHLLGDLDRAVASLKALRERGVRVSIDDFGTGYSAMNYLRQLPDRRDQDRPQLRDRRHRQRRGRERGRRRHGDRPVARARGDRRGHRDRRPPRVRPRAWVQPSAGLPDRAADRRRRGRADAARPGAVGLSDAQSRAIATNGSSDDGSFSAPLLATRSGSAPSRIFFTGSSSFLPLSVVGIDGDLVDLVGHVARRQPGAQRRCGCARAPDRRRRRRAPTVVEHDEQHERAGVVGVGRLEVHDEAVDDAVDRLDDAVDLGGADADAAPVERGVGATGDDAAAALGDR